MVQGSLKLAIVFGLGVLMASCGGSSSPVRPGAGAGAALPPPPVAADQCGAYTLQSLIGQPRTEIPVPVEITSRRVTCTTCPLTEDYSPSRLNILYNRSTGLVERVYCG